MYLSGKVFLGLWHLVQLLAETAGRVATLEEEQLTVANESYISEEHRLFTTLMEHYQSSVRPVRHAKDVIQYYIEFSLHAIIDLDEKEQILLLTGMMRHKWTDIQLVWNPDDFGGHDTIRIPITQLWIPDLSVYNSKGTSDQIMPMSHLSSVDSKGVITWVHPLVIDTHCAVDLSEFPFDEHTCNVIFGLWANSAAQVNLTVANLEHFDLSAFLPNNEWELKTVNFTRNLNTYPCCPDPYIDITYKFTIKRGTTFVTHLFIGPSVILCIITPAIFLLPPGGGERMVIGIGVIIADVLLLGELTNFVPSAHPNIPLLGKYYIGNIVMACLSIAISTIIVGFWDKSNSRIVGPPAFFRLLILGQLARFLCVRKEDYLTMDDTGATLEITPDDSVEVGSGTESGSEQRRRCMNNYLRNAARSEWRQLAVVFDRLFFVTYCVILSILTLCFARYL